MEMKGWATEIHLFSFYLIFAPLFHQVIALCNTADLSFREAKGEHIQQNQMNVQSPPAEITLPVIYIRSHYA